MDPGVETHDYKSQATLRFYSAWGPLGTVAALVAGLLFLVVADVPRRPYVQLLFLLGLAFLPVAFDMERRLARLLRIVRATGTTPVGQAGPGYVELTGRAQAHGPLLKSPQGGQACVWHRVEQWMGKRLVSNASYSRFVLRDATGECVIEAGDAHVYGTLAGVESTPGRSKRKEYLIRPGDPLYAIGELALERKGDVPGPRDESRPPPARERPAVDMLAHWQRDPEAFARQFDANRDGAVDAKEMLAARIKAAEFEKARGAGPRPAAAAASPPPADTLTRVRVLRKPADQSLPFLVMNRPVEAVERFLALRVWAVRLMAVMAIAAVWMAVRILFPH
ncbi:MAG: hypothetical protein ACT4P9_14820 [Betaproteobacteria bacterium]